MTGRMSAARAGGLSRRRVRAVWLATGAMLVLSAVCVVVIPEQPKMPSWAFLVFTAMAALLTVVGGLVVTRQPRNAVGWILWLAGMASFVSTLSSAYANFAVTPAGAVLPGATLVAWLAPIAFFPSLVAIVILVPLLFPDGRFLGPRWRWVGALGTVGIALIVAGSMFQPGPLPDYPTVVNPVGIPGFDTLRPLLDAANTWAMLVAAALAIVSAFARYRRGNPVERTQLRWFGAAAGLTVSLLILSFGLGTGDASSLAWLGAIISLSLMPVAIGVAILRYRLYEIDRIISRTIGWAIVTALLAAILVAGVVILETILAPVTTENTLAVAGSTLIAAALFQPVRRRVQRAVDHRFDRARYDGQGLADALAERLRSEVDLATIRASLA